MSGLVLNEEQQLLQKSARELFDTVAPLSELRRLRDAKDKNAFTPELWKKMAELGWTAMIVPEQYGGIDFGFSGLGVVMCEAGRTLSASPLLMTVAAGVPVLLRSASEDIKTRLLPQIAGGECTVTLALEEGLHHDPYGGDSVATGQGDKYTLSGEKRMVFDGGFADWFLVTAHCGKTKSTDANIGLFLVDGSAGGVERTALCTIDNRNVAHISFKRVPAVLLAKGQSAKVALDFALDAVRVTLAAEMLGGALESFERTVGYLKEREQFGSKIGSFQALQHRVAQLYVHLELTRSALLDAIAKVERAWDGKDKERVKEMAIAASLAKTYAGECYQRVASESVQMHGGIGMTDEFDIGFFLKRMQVAAQSFGDANFLCTRYADLVGV